MLQVQPRVRTAVTGCSCSCWTLPLPPPPLLPWELILATTMALARERTHCCHSFYVILILDSDPFVGASDWSSVDHTTKFRLQGRLVNEYLKPTISFHSGNQALFSSKNHTLVNFPCTEGEFRCWTVKTWHAHTRECTHV